MRGIYTFESGESSLHPIMALFQAVSPSLSALFGSIDGHVKAGAPVFAGSAGTIAKRTNQHGVEYYARRYYDGAGKQQEIYLGRVGESEDKIAALQAQIAEVKAIVPELRLLVREGFQSADAKTYATLASLHSHGLFAAGATLIGSHAFGVLLNQMGIRAAAYATEDVDVARREVLAFERVPDKSFLEMLRDSGINFVEVPQLDRKQLKTHATALPYLAYVLGQTQITTLISREGCCPVRVPLPERFAIHKLVVSQLRTNREAKTDKDVFQASVLLAALGEKFPGAVETAVTDLPASARKYLAKALPFALKALRGYPRATDELQAAIAQAARTSRARRRPSK